MNTGEDGAITHDVEYFEAKETQCNVFLIIRRE